MMQRQRLLLGHRRRLTLPWALTTLLVLPAAAVHGQQSKTDGLHIGASGTLTGGAGGAKERAALESLQAFIKSETGLNNDIVRQKHWQELAARMADGKLQIGVFQGYEFAWAKEKYPALKPLAVAVNVYRYPVAYVVARKDNKATDFAALQGQTLALPETPEGHLRLFAQRQSQASGKKLDGFFSKVTSRENAEDILDDIVDGKVQVTVVDRTALDAYKRRKPGRFKQLKPVARSQPFPPGIVAYCDAVLDKPTLDRFREGLLGANRKEKGQMMLTMFKLTGFEAAPSDLDEVLAKTRKAYPPSTATAKAP